MMRPAVADAMLHLPFRQNREPAVDKFDVHPVDQQRSLAELDDGAESASGRIPSGTTRRRQNKIIRRIPQRIRKKLGLVCQ